MKKRVFKYIAIGILVLYVFIQTMVFSFGQFAKPVKSKCIIILGCSVYGKTPSPFLKERLDQGIKLYKDGYGKVIIVSGGKGSGEQISEADAMYNYLIKNGISNSKIIKENKSETTYENIYNCEKIMAQKNINDAVIVSNKFHLFRAYIIGKKLKLSGTYSGIFVSSYKLQEMKGYLREVPAVFKSLVYK